MAIALETLDLRKGRQTCSFQPETLCDLNRRLGWQHGQVQALLSKLQRAEVCFNRIIGERLALDIRITVDLNLDVGTIVFPPVLDTKDARHLVTIKISLSLRSNYEKTQIFIENVMPRLGSLVYAYFSTDDFLQV